MHCVERDEEEAGERRGKVLGGHAGLESSRNQKQECKTYPTRQRPISLALLYTEGTENIASNTSFEVELSGNPSTDATAAVQTPEQNGSALTSAR